MDVELISEAEYSKVQSHADTDHLAHYSASSVESNDDDGMSTLFQNMRAFGGYVNTLLALPFGVCGGGPIQTVEEGHKACVLVNGKLDRIVGPGTYHYNVGVERYMIRSMKIRTLDVPQQSMMTKDDVTVAVNAVCYYQIRNLKKAVFAVENVDMATSNFAQCTLRTVVGENTLDQLFQDRKNINHQLTSIIDTETDKWGVYVSVVEIKDIIIPKNMQRVMAAVAEAHREGNAKVITAEAELRASSILSDAAAIMSQNPVSLQLRYFQTLTEVAAEKNSTIIIPSEAGSMFQGLATALGQQKHDPTPCISECQ